MTRQGTLGVPLSAVQLRILTWTAEGKTAAEIAAEHHYALDTVKGHLYRTRRQLGARNGAHAIHIAHQRGLLGKDGAA